MKTTLNKIRENAPCTEGWEKLLKHLGKTKADDEELDLLTILESNGLADALWCLRAVDGYDREMRLYAVWCARQVQHLMTDQRSIDALYVAERYANGQASDDDLLGARDAAWDAAAAAGYATAWVASMDVAHPAAWVAAWYAARAVASTPDRDVDNITQESEFRRMLKEGYAK